ncbi:MAG: flagellar biosynthetic protein FliO [Deltaproteobacteria bacterium]|nr:flagellar biosynthetic protein FliO [Deltaproteobacteria bacterium]
MMTDSYVYLLLKAFFSLALVLVMLGAFLYGLKRLMKRAGLRRMDADEPIKVLRVFQLEHKKSLTVVDVAGEVIVLGVTPASVNMVMKVERPEAADELRRRGNGRCAGLFGLFKRV